MKNKFNFRRALISFQISAALVLALFYFGSASKPIRIEEDKKEITYSYERLAEELAATELPLVSEITESKFPKNMERYFNKYLANAILEYNKFKIPPSVKLLQGFKETGGGKSKLARKANNYFGIKARKRHKKTAKAADDCGENLCSFAHFDGYWHSSRDHSKILCGKMYSNRHKFSHNAKDWIVALKKYATSKNYSKDLLEQYEKYELWRLDKWVENKYPPKKETKQED